MTGVVVPEPVDDHPLADAAGRHAMSTMTAGDLDPTVDRSVGQPGRGGSDAWSEPLPWLTANVRPAGSFGRADVGRLRALLDALSATASMVVLDLAAVTLRSHHAADVIDEAAVELERRGGCLLCINADADVRAQLRTCTHAVVVVPPGEPAPAAAPR